MRRLNRLISALCLGFISFHAHADKGFLDFNVYPYLSEVDSDSVFTLNIANRINTRWSYFSLLNLSGDGSRGPLENTQTYYTEQNIRYSFGQNSPLDATVQWNLRSGEDSDRLRLGLRWRLQDTAALSPFMRKHHLSYSLNFHLLQLDHSPNTVWQIEHSFFWRWPELSERLYLAGFIDHTFGEDLPPNFPSNPIVAEAQMGWRLAPQFYLVMEYRINEYRRSDVNNLALGVQYKMPF